jgi:hypothetical protein
MATSLFRNRYLLAATAFLAGLCSALSCAAGEPGKPKDKAVVLTYLKQKKDGKWEVGIRVPSAVLTLFTRSSLPPPLMVGKQVLKSVRFGGRKGEVVGLLERQPRAGDHIRLAGRTAAKNQILSEGIGKKEIEQAKLAGPLVRRPHGPVAKDAPRATVRLILLAQRPDKEWEVWFFAPFIKKKVEREKSPLLVQVGKHVLKVRKRDDLPVSICGALAADAKAGDRILLLQGGRTKPLTLAVLSPGITQTEMRRARLAGVLTTSGADLTAGPVLREIKKGTNLSFRTALTFRESVLGHCHKDLGYPRLFLPGKELRLSKVQYARLASAVALIGYCRAGEYSDILVRHIVDKPRGIGDDRLPRLRQVCTDALAEIGTPARRTCLVRLSEEANDAKRKALVSLLCTVESPAVARILVKNRLDKEADKKRAVRLRQALELIKEVSTERESKPGRKAARKRAARE